jgi:hypothetical protein
LRIGEMERDGLAAHGITGFLRESLMERADKAQIRICNGCGTVPIFNSRQKLFVCPMCDGPVAYIGDSPNTLEILPATKRSVVTFSKVEIPYAFKLLEQEMNTYLNMSMRVLTRKDVSHFRPYPIAELTEDQQATLLDGVLPDRVLPETTLPVYLTPPEEPEVRPEDLAALGAVEVPEEVVKEAPVPTAPAAAPNPNDGVLMKVGNMNLSVAQPSAPVAASSGISLEDDDTDDMPFAPASGAVSTGAQGQGQGVNVQTTNQPVLVVPLSMTQAPAPTEVIPPATPGAPSTIAVDTSETAMRGIGAPSQPTRPVTPNRKPTQGAPTNQVVSVNKVGATPAAAPPNANVRVSVNKLG